MIRSGFWIVLITIVIALFAGFLGETHVFAQEGTPGVGDVYITVVYTEQINIRNGPSTVLYDIIGNMLPGETAKALGVSPGRDWVQIAHPAGPGGLAWVHTSLISLSEGNLPIVEPPPTATPLVTATVDPTLAAAYVFEPTATRMPTFTAPPPLEIPQFTETPAENQQEKLPIGALVLGLGIPGIFGYFLTTLRRR